ncbi:MAG: HipA family kinase [Solirubrobacterales bacterium]
MRRVTATRYVTALREGGSLPGLVEADDDGLYVVKFRGAGQGPGVLVSEVVAGELGRAIGLRIPELVVMDVAPELGHAEPDPEIQELINASPGANLAMDFLPGALPFDGSSSQGLDPGEAAAIVWFDWLITNVDRTPRNPNLLTWHGDLWLIDHGAAFFRQHGSEPLSMTAERPTPMMKEHVLLPGSGSVREAGELLAESANEAVGSAVAAVPSEWLGPEPDSAREQFRLFVEARLKDPAQLEKDLHPDD